MLILETQISKMSIDICNFLINGFRSLRAENETGARPGTDQIFVRAAFSVDVRRAALPKGFQSQAPELAVRIILEKELIAHWKTVLIRMAIDLASIVHT